MSWHLNCTQMLWNFDGGFSPQLLFIFLRFSGTSVNNSLRFGRQGQVSIPQGRCGQHIHQENRHPQAFQDRFPLEQGQILGCSGPPAAL